MSVLDNILEKIKIFFKSMSEKSGIDFPKIDQWNEQYTNVPRWVIQEIRKTDMLYPHDPECDIVVQNLVENILHVSKIFFTQATIEFHMDNGTIVSMWIENLWYGFMSSISIVNKKLQKKTFSRKQPSKEMMIRFLDVFHNCLNFEPNKITPPLEKKNEWLVKDFFNFDNVNEEETDAPGRNDKILDRQDNK